MLLYSEKWHEGYNDGYWLGRDGSVIGQVIYGAYSSYGGEYGKGLQSGYDKGRSHVQRREQGRIDELKGLRDKGKDRDR
jgi:hypothetical protein